MRRTERNICRKGKYSQRETIVIGHLNTTQKQAARASKRFIKNWRPILIASQQTAYVKNRPIEERGKLISDVMEITKIKNIEAFLITMDTEKALDSLDHKFLIFTNMVLVKILSYRLRSY